MNILFNSLQTLAEVIAVAALADFLSGVIHWIEDAYFEEDTPVVGRLFIQPNIVHHHLPRYFTKLSWWDSSKDLLFVGVALLAAASWLDLLTWHVWLFVGLGVNANEIHKWSHRTRAENGKVISWLQDMHILQTPRHHGLHHTDPKNTYYCPITNFVNPALEAISFWGRLEAVVQKLTGISHRPDTAVRGQGPGPDWLAEFRPACVRYTEVKHASQATNASMRSCGANCGRCSLACRSPANEPAAVPAK